jgi:hypothetical protein
MRHLFLIIPICFSLSAISQGPSHANGDAASPRNLQQRVYGLHLYSGAVLVHNHDVQSIENAKPKGFSFDLSRQFIDSPSYAYCRSYIRKGITFSFYNLGTAILGNGFIASYFLEPVYRIGNKFQFQFRGDMGAGYFTAPFDSIKNPGNNNYSLRITPYLHVSAGFGFHITKKLIIAGNANFNHISNGNYREPNAGLNWSTFSAAVLYYPESGLLPKYAKPPRYKWSEKKAGVDAGLMFVPKQGYHRKWKNTRNYMAGMFLVATKKISRISALSAGTELYYNKFVDAPGVAPDNSKPATLAGVYFGHEFLFNKIIFSQQYGRYISDYPSFFKSATYHRWGLRYKLNNRLYAGFNMKVHRFTADFIDLRLQYKIL